MAISRFITYLPTDGRAPDALVVLLHGLGNDGAGILRQLMSPLKAALPRAAFIAPDAPEPCDIRGYGLQWFSMADPAWPVMARLAGRATPDLVGFLEARLAAHRLPVARLALVGDSQGCMMALNAGLALPASAAAIAGFSGLLLAGAEFETKGSVARPPVLLVHGEADDVVPLIAMHATESRLRSAGIPVETLSRPELGHGVDADGLARAAAFLAARLGG